MKKKLLFYLLLLTTLTANSQQLSKYRYWFGNDLSTGQTVISADTSLDFLLNVSNFNYGLQQVNFQFQDVNSRWSSVISQFFYKRKITNAQLQKFRYWFNENFAGAKTLLVGNSANNDFVTSIDVDGLSNGRYQLNYQFSDDGNAWSSVISDSITKTPITSRNNLYPVITLNKIKLNTNDTLKVIGNRFTLNGQVSLTITTDNENAIIVDTTLIADTLGNIEYNFKATSNLFTGGYFVKATNSNTDETTDSRRFVINGLIKQEKLLTVAGPRNTKDYSLNKPLDIQWQEKNDDKHNIDFMGRPSTNYKIEVQINNSAFTEIANIYKSGLFNQPNSYSYRYTPTTAGTYKFRVTNLYLPTRQDTSRTISCVVYTPGINVNYVWDYSGNSPQDVEVKGVAADGTARILMHIVRQAGNSKNISKVDVQLSDGFSTSNTKLGKLAAATVTGTYSLEANTATATSLSLVNTGNDVWIWYVAPDDYYESARGNDGKYLPQRAVKAEFKITYSDQSQEVVDKTIEIIRPPIMLVHGLGGSPSTWDNFVFTSNTGTQKFYNPGNNILGTIVKPVSMMGNSSFRTNARILLNLNQSNTFNEFVLRNSFQKLLEETRNNGFAANKVDYVCHSMGGSMGRSAINAFPEAYNTTLTGNYLYKNYQKGFINKFISIETPYNGSPLAEVAKKLSNQLVTSTVLLPVSAAENDLAGSFWNISSNGIFISITDAVSDLQYKEGGVRFNATTVKNHLIGANVGTSTNDCDITWENIKKDENLSSLPKMYRLLLGANIINPFFGCNQVNNYFTNTFGLQSFLQNSDAVVPINSQLPGKDINGLDNSFTKFFGFEFNHLKSTKSLNIGNKVFDLLNTDIGSDYFANTIVQNNNPGGYSQRITGGGDSVIERVDTTRIKIVSPTYNSSYKYDSIIAVGINLKDTNSLIESRVIFQGEIYSSLSKVKNQIFNIPVNPILKGKEVIIASAIYDSSGVNLIYTDSVTVNILPHDTLTGFKIEPEAMVLNPGQTYYPLILGYYNKQVAYFHYSDTSIKRAINNTNVVQFDSRGLLIAKDTGTTIVTYSYRGFKDTLVIIIDTTSRTSIVTAIQGPSQASGIVISVYPNPVTDNKVTVDIQSPRLKKYKLQFVDVLGRTVYTDEFERSGHITKDYNLPYPDQGVLLMTLYANGEFVETKKIVFIRK